MKKNNTLAVILIGLLVFIVFILAGFLYWALQNNNNENAKFEFFKFNASNQVQYETEFDQGDIKNVDISLISQDVNILLSKDEKFHVKVYDNDKNIKAIVEDGTLIVKNDLKPKVCLFCITLNSRVELYVPQTYVDNFKIKTVSGDIEVSKFANSSFDLKSTSGDIELDSVYKVSATTTSGEFDLKEANEVDIKTTSGDITIGSVGNASIVSLSGDVEIDSCTIKKIKTTSGDVVIKGETRAIGIVDVTTKSGNVIFKQIIDSYVSYNTKSGTVRINDIDRKSDNEIKIKTTSGDIIVN